MEDFVLAHVADSPSSIPALAFEVSGYCSQHLEDDKDIVEG